MACVMQQIIMGLPQPFAHLPDSNPEVILEKLRRGKLKRSLRPTAQTDMCPPEIAVLIKQCWAMNPLERPRIAQVKSVLREVRRGSSEGGSILDMLIQRMEIYTEDLEKIVQEKTLLHVAERQKTEQLLYQVLPRAVAEQLQRGESVLPESYRSCSVLNTDIVGFTALASASTPFEVVDFLNSLYTTFDICISKFDAYKIETIGDSYVVASGIPERNGDRHATELCRLSLTLLKATANFKIAHKPEEPLQMRLGVHSGPVVAGVVGLRMPRYCL
ncbi:hypothetical protein RvY_07397-2 [Ramazzottius varieornatus]|nr:hypothetical protein RvY_07397-2 [Ramazzottius varieornatus]